MSVLKQVKPTFRTVQELRLYIANKEDSLTFWSMLRSVDTSEILKNLRGDIMDAKRQLEVWEQQQEINVYPEEM